MRTNKHKNTKNERNTNKQIFLERQKERKGKKREKKKVGEGPPGKGYVTGNPVTHQSVMGKEEEECP